MSDWRSISTAPRDEVPKLGYGPNGFDILIWPLLLEETADHYSNGRWFNGDVYVEPTHWMPLPAPPK